MVNICSCRKNFVPLQRERFCNSVAKVQKIIDMTKNKTYPPSL